MLKTYLISSIVLTLFLGAAGVSTAVKEIQREQTVAPISIDGEPVSSMVNNEVQVQTREQLMLGPSVNATATPIQDCDGTPDQDRLQDRDQDRTQDRDQDRIYQSESTGIRNHGGGQADNGNGAGNGNGGRP